MRPQIKKLKDKDNEFVQEHRNAFIIIKNKKAYWAPSIKPINNEEAKQIKSIGLDEVKHMPAKMEMKLVDKLNEYLKKNKKKSSLKNS